MSQNARPGGPPKKARVVTFSLRIPTLIGGLLALVVGLIWIFILGILVGRGQAPETQIPQIAGLMPRVEADPAPPRIVDPAPAGVIPAGELSYVDALKQGRPRPQAAAPAHPAEAPTPAERVKPQEKPQAVPGAEKPGTQKFDYVYQVAAYKAAAPCDALVAKLKTSGLKAFTEKSDEKGATWYKTMVTFRGTPDDVDKLRANLLPHKLTRLILKTKTPVR